MLKKNEKTHWIRYIYLYLVTAISIVILIISVIGLIRLGLQEYVFDLKGWEEMPQVMPDGKIGYYQCSDDNLFYVYDLNGKRVLKSEYKKSDEKELAVERAECEVSAKKLAENQHKNNVGLELISFISMLIVALPVYVYHWSVIKKDSKK